MNDFEKLLGFAKDVMNLWPESNIDALDIQEIAVKHGLLVEKTMYANCSVEGVSNCTCADFCTDGEFAAGIECLRKSELIK